MTAEILFADL